MDGALNFMRVEKTSTPDSHEVASEVASEVAAKMRKQVRRKAGLSCCSIFIVIILAIAIFVSVSVARTGLFKIPVVSALVYSEPSPVRVVPAGEPLDSFISNAMQKIIRERLANGQITNRDFVLTLPEGSFTRGLQDSIKNAKVSGLSVADGAQLAVLDGEAELFLPIKRNGASTALIVRFVPEAKDGRLVLTMRETRIGKLKLPSFIARMIEKSASDSMSQFNSEVGKYAQIEQIDLREGELVLRGRIIVNVEVLKEL
ncbi:MAG: hypothetical protein ACD_76C00012G0003 [uncultured bacterium]|nr:MAG: hypothetical protein ACD_76C00012G0003 [uncultured bacterium]HBD04943.1 hypothetical protein [Candidatus Uhrbacteria bacterium]